MDSNKFDLVVRFSDNMFGVGDVVSRHNEVVAKRGYVWFGKMGSTISFQRIELLNKQLESNTPTFLFLAQGNWKKPRFYRARLLAISREFPAIDKRCIPAYYSKKGLLEYMSVWIKIGKIVPVRAKSLQNLRTINSVLQFQETLVRSSSGYFMVHEVTREQF